MAWRPLPPDLWQVLASPIDVRHSRQREQVALAAVLAMALLIVAAITGAGLGSGASAPSLPATLWVVLPPLAGWAFVRRLWIPLATAGRPDREPALAFARYLSGVYLYVYLMIVLGAALVLLLAWVAPTGSHLVRYCLWWFLFGESFFVPAVMWLRLVRNDSSGNVFGRFRYPLLVVYLTVFVAYPAAGMWRAYASAYSL